MTETAPDVIGEALLRAFADRGYDARLPEFTTVSVRLPDGSTATADITAWREHAGRGGPDVLPRAAADYADQAARAFERSAGQVQADTSANLRVRLYTDDALGGMRDALVTRPLAPGLVETVVVDYPDSIMPLERARLGGLSEDEVFGTALAQSLEEQHYTSTDTVQGVPVTHVGGEHLFVGAHAHVLRRHAERAPYGALVSFPLPEYVLVHVIGDVHLFAAMETVQDLSQRLFDSGEKALSPQVYWWRPGPYEELPEAAALRGGQVPDLRPVGIKVDHQEKSVAFQTTDTDRLAELWLNDHA
ncbi:hypothetical protein SAMN05444920_114260 [Nonomuraea solani]|uniref:Uncharacterized protein n=1 Tax=Nonomuraea solani TaxID=1144553 RepID=A0A1H6ETH1_9ACTN|nr:hypothetical protein [Nonomuraea solani]SEG99984.1 hypothetical protein SAMN05444920_114260 [Nonomuraea solani]